MTYQIIKKNYLTQTKVDAKRCKSKEVESMEVLTHPFHMNEDIDMKGFVWIGHP